MKEIGLYYRVSTPPQDTPDKDSITSQQTTGRAFAESKNTPYREYQDIYSGGKAGRKGFDKLSDDIEAGVIDAIWVRDISRLARDVFIGSGIFDLLKRKKGVLFNGEQKVDPSNYQEIFGPNIELALVQYQRGAIRANTMRGRKASTDKGNRVSHSIYGYDSKRNEQGHRYLIENPEESKVVRKVFDLYRKGNSFRHIAKLLNDQAIPTKFKKKWTQTHVGNMVRKVEYIGYVNDWEGKKLIRANYVPAILKCSFEEWKDIVGSINKEAEQRNRNGYKLSNHDISGLIRCELCNCQYYFKHDALKNQMHYYHHSTSEKERICKVFPKYLKIDIERVFEYCTFSVFAYPFETATYVKNSLKEIEQRNQDSLLSITDISAKIKQLDRAINNLLDIVESQGNNIDVDDRLKKRRAEKHLLETTLVTMAKEIERDKRDMLEIQMDFSMEMFKKLTDVKADGATKRSIYYSLIHSAIVRDGILMIHFKNTKRFEIKIASRHNTRWEIEAFYMNKPQYSLIFDSSDYSRYYQSKKGFPEDFLLFNGFPGSVSVGDSQYIL